MTVAFQGETGAFSEEAVHVLFPHAATLAYPTMEAVFGAVVSGDAGRGMIPIENSLFGSVHVNYDLLRTHDVRIVGELMLRVRHNLLAPQGMRLTNIRQVLSHPQALGQCQDFLRDHLPQVQTVPAYDTAGAAKLVAKDPALGSAAIASLRAAQEYGLQVLAEGIESHRQNYTRFLALALPDAAPTDRAVRHPAKTSIAFALRKNEPGALFKSLAVFALRELDLHKIESRPLIGSPGRYRFYLDVAGSLAETAVKRALTHLEEITSELRVLGSYPVGPVWEGSYPSH